MLPVMKKTLLFFMLCLPFLLPAQQDTTVHNLKFEDGILVKMKIEHADGELTPDLFIGVRLLGTAYVMKNFSTRGTARAAVGYNYVEAMMSGGVDGFYYPFRWYKTRPNSGLINLCSTPRMNGSSQFLLHFVRIYDVRVVRQLGLHGGIKQKVYPNGNITFGNDTAQFNVEKLRIPEASIGIGFTSRRGLRIKVLETNAKAKGNHDWVGTQTHYFTWSVYADLVMDLKASYTTVPIPYGKSNNRHTPVWQDSYAPKFPLTGWRVAADMWWSRLGYSKKGRGNFGLSGHIGLQQTFFSWFGNGVTFYSVIGLTYSIKTNKKQTKYYGYKLAPDLRRKNGSKLIFY